MTQDLQNDDFSDSKVGLAAVGRSQNEDHTVTKRRSPTRKQRPTTRRRPLQQNKDPIPTKR
jgi:hypothetical protein